MSPDQESVLFYYDPNPSESRAVILLHGLGADGESWGYQAAALSRVGFRPITPDLPGFGRSPLPADVEWDIARCAQMVTCLLDQLGLDRFVLVGHSMGGTVAQQLALNAGDRSFSASIRLLTCSISSSAFMLLIVIAVVQ